MQHQVLARWKWCVASLVWAAVVVETAPAHARPKYNTAFREAHPEIVELAKAAGCAVCHVGKTKKVRNDFGAAVGKALGKKNVMDAAAIRKALDAAEATPAFVALDNEKNLDGWTGKTEGWTVVDGAIHLAAREARGSIYSATTHSRSAVIRLRFRATERADSGVYVHGKQLQVRDYPTAGPRNYAEHAKEAGLWNDLELDIRDGVATVRLNGHVIEERWAIGNKADQGVGLQKERGDFDFRYLRVLDREKKSAATYGDVIKEGKLPDRVIKGVSPGTSAALPGAPDGRPL